MDVPGPLEVGVPRFGLQPRNLSFFIKKIIVIVSSLTSKNEDL